MMIWQRNLYLVAVVIQACYGIGVRKAPFLQLPRRDELNQTDGEVNITAVAEIILNSADLTLPSQNFDRRLDYSDTEDIPCSSNYLLNFVPEFRDYMNCVYSEPYDGTKAGSWWLTQMNCWCQHQTAEAVNRTGCCDFSVPGSCDFHQEHGCNPDCASQAAKECESKCNARCFEGMQSESYYPEEGCDACTDECYEFSKCIVAASDETVCHIEKYANQADIYQQLDCVSRYSFQNAWLLQNAEVHCRCEAGMIDLAQDTKCCEHYSCDECLTEEQCSSAEAQKCHEDCGTEHCGAFDWQTPDETCVTQCLMSNAPCAKYLSCAPQVRPSFEYVCDDGSSPNVAGCCRNATGVPSCPTLCDDPKPAHSFRFYNQYTLSECECHGCPASLQEKAEKIDNMMTNVVDKYIKESLIIASVEYRLDAPTRTMYNFADEHRKNVQTLLQTSMDPQDELDAYQVAFLSEMKKLAEQGAEDRKRQDENAEQLQQGTDDNEVSWDNVITKDSENYIPWYLVLIIVVLSFLVGFLIFQNRNKARYVDDFHHMTTPGLVQSQNSADVVLGRPAPITNQAYADNVYTGTTVVTMPIKDDGPKTEEKPKALEFGQA